MLLIAESDLFLQLGYEKPFFLSQQLGIHVIVL